MPLKRANSQRGIAQIILLLFLVASIAAGTYIVQNRTNFLPHAECIPVIGEEGETVDCIEEPPKPADNGGSGGSGGSGGGGGNSGGSSGGSGGGGGCQPVDYCDGGNVIHKTCNTDGSANFEPKLADSSCKNDDGSHRPDGNVIRMPAPRQTVTVGSDGKTTSDGQSLGTQTQSTKDRFYATYCGSAQNHCPEAERQWAKEHVVHVNTNSTRGNENIENCRSTSCDNPRSLNGKTWENVPKEEQNRYFATYCTGDDAGNRCQQAKVAWMNEQDAICRREGTCASSASANQPTEQQRLADQQKAATELKATLDAVRLKLDTDGFKYDESICQGITPPQCLERNKLACFSAVTPEKAKDCENNMKILQEISEAQKAHDRAGTLTGVSQQAAYDEAKLLARAANCDAVAAGIPGSNCVLDMGDPSQYKTATVNGQPVRVFLGCSTTEFDSEGRCRKILNYRPEGCIPGSPKLTTPECQPKELPPEVAKGLGVTKPIYNVKDLPPDLLKSAQIICKGTGNACYMANGAPPATAQTPPATTGYPVACTTYRESSGGQSCSAQDKTAGKAFKCTGTKQCADCGCQIESCSATCETRSTTTTTPKTNPPTPCTGTSQDNQFCSNQAQKCRSYIKNSAGQCVLSNTCGICS